MSGEAASPRPPRVDPAISIHASIRRQLLAGGLAAIVLVCGAGGWAATAEFAGAVIAGGKLVVDSNDKKVQHLTGGIVSALLVQDGDHVEAGDVLVRLDETVTRANLAIVDKSLDEIEARLARLEAERDGTDAIAMPASLAGRASPEDAARLMQAEAGLFQLRRQSRQGQKAQLEERIDQLGEEIDGLTNQIDAKANELALIAGELDGVRKLYKKNLVPLERVNKLERETARLQGERGQLIAATAQAKGKISETQLQILQIDQDLRSEVAKEIREAQGKVAELVERKVAAEDQLKRVELKAPQSGVVHELAIHTVGGVVNPGEPVMVIVPDGDRLVVEAKIAPQDIDSVSLGQASFVRFSAFDARTTPEVEGMVQRVSADQSVDQRSGIGFYTVRIGLTPESLATLKERRLTPGMPVEAYIQTPPRTVLSYLTRPLVDQVGKAFRGD